jgi:hypothetical protein
VTTAIAPLRPEPAPGHIQLAASNVACNLRANAVDKRSGMASYELSLANDGAVAVSGRLYGIDRRQRERTFGALEVAAHSVGRSHFAVPVEWTRSDEHLYMEVVGEGVHLVAEAQRLPVGRGRSRPLSPLAWPVFGAGAVLAVTAGIALFGPGIGLAAPSIVALGVPHRALPGPVSVFYAIGGRANASYRATLPSGASVAAGRLIAASGEIAIAVPPAAAGQSVEVTVDASGPLGHAARSAVFPVDAAAPPAARAQISNLTARRETYGGMQSAIVSYSAVGDGGAVRLFDPRGTVVGSAPFSHVGTARISLPDSTSAETLRAELQVARGTSRAHASVDLPPASDGGDAAAEKMLAKALRGVAAANASSTSGDNGPSTDVTDTTSAQDAGSTPLPSDPFYVPGRVVGGRSFEVALRRVLPHMHLELQDEMGTSLDDKAVPPGATSVSLSVPATKGVQTYYLAATFVQASGEDTIVRSLRVFPE